MRTVARLLTVLVLCGGGAASPALAQDWVEHKPDGIGYRIEMPAAPQITNREVPSQIGPIKTTLALVDRRSRAFMVSHNDYPAAMVANSTPERILDGVRDGQVGRHKLRSEQKLNLGNHAARHLVIETAGRQIIVSRFTLVQARLIQAVYVGPVGSEESEDAKRFIESFALVER